MLGFRVTTKRAQGFRGLGFGFGGLGLLQMYESHFSIGSFSSG